MHNVTAIILAAGKGTRMNSNKAKVLHALNGKPLVQHVIDACRAADINDMIVVVGHDHESVVAALDVHSVRFAYQHEQKGTGHAVSCAEAMIKHETVIVLCGDAPFVNGQTLHELIQHHHAHGNACTAVGASLVDPAGYGRLVVTSDGMLQRIVEHRDATAEEREITLVNSGTYIFNRQHLFAALKRIRPANAQGELYLTDVISILTTDGLPVGLFVADDPRTVLGINTPQQLAAAKQHFSKQ